MSSLSRIAIISMESTPYQGSECALGWGLPLEIAKQLPDTKISIYTATGSWREQTRYKEDYEKYQKLIGNLPKNVEHHYVPFPKKAKLICSINRIFYFLGPVGISFLFFLIVKIWRSKAIDICKKDNYQLIHFITPISLASFSRDLYLKVPYIIGPTGGISKLNGYRKNLSFVKRIFENLRNIYLSYLQYKMKRFTFFKNCSGIILFDKRETSMFLNVQKYLFLPDSCSKIVKKNLNEIKENEKTKIICVGQMTERKQNDLLVEVFEDNPQLADYFDVELIGDGPHYQDILKKVKENTFGNIKMIRSVPYDQMNNIYRNADILVHMSYREACTHVIPEAISYGLCVICHNVGGVEHFVSEKNGKVIDLIDRQYSKRALTKQLMVYARNKDIIATQRQVSLDIAAKSTYETHAHQITDMYDTVIAKT